MANEWFDSKSKLVKNSERINKVDHDTLLQGELFQEFYKQAAANRGENIRFYYTEEMQKMYGEGITGYEIKLDNVCTGYGDTKRASGRLSIEYQKYLRTRGNTFFWANSGILNTTSTAHVYVVVCPDVTWDFDRKILVDLYKMLRPDQTHYYDRGVYVPSDQWKEDLTPKTTNVTKSPIKKFYLPIEDADMFCIRKIVYDGLKSDIVLTPNYIENINNRLSTLKSNRSNFDFEFEQLMNG